MAKILSISESTRFRVAVAAPAKLYVIPRQTKSWDTFTAAITSPVTVVGLFLLFMVACAAVH